MGEIADMLREGILCEICGSYIDEDHDGEVRLCEDCEMDNLQDDDQGF